MKRVFVTIFLVTSITQSSHAASVSATVTIIPDHTLPGLPVVLYLDVVNSGDSAFVLSREFTIEATTGLGEVFLIRNGRTLSHVQHLPKLYEHSRTIPDGGRARFQIPLGDQLTQGAFVSDARTWQPGTYSVQLLFGEHQDTEPVQLASSKANLVVEQPTGEEERVWQAVVTETRGRGFEADVRASASSARKIFPTLDQANRYWPYLAVMATPSDEDARTELQKAIYEQIPADHLLSSQLRVELAQTRLRQAIRRASEQGAGKEQRDEVVAALTELERLASDDASDVARSSASAALKRVRYDSVVEAGMKDRQDNQ